MCNFLNPCAVQEWERLFESSAHKQLTVLPAPQTSVQGHLVQNKLYTDDARGCLNTIYLS